MSVIVKDDGFHPEDWTGYVVEVTAETEITALDLDAPLIKVAFPSSADGRGFTLARQLRALGYKGRLRAQGHVLADQYAMARRSGFDEVEIDEKLAARQPQEQWLARADWRAHDYQTRLRQSPAV